MPQLSQLFPPEAIVVDLDAGDRNDALAKLVSVLAETNRLDADAVAEVTRALQERERQGSTGFGKSVAVPHVKHPLIREMVGAIGRLSRPIDFNSLDGRPVSLVVLLLSPPDRSREHLDAMQAIFKVLQQDLLRRDLLAADRRDAIREVLRQADPVPA